MLLLLFGGDSDGYSVTVANGTYVADVDIFVVIYVDIFVAIDVVIAIDEVVKVVARVAVVVAVDAVGIILLHSKAYIEMS